MTVPAVAPALTLLAEHRCFGGVQRTYSHPSAATGTVMRLAVYLPPQAEAGPVPALVYLSGLTCTEENFTIKAGAQRYAAEHGIALVAPDTSPRGDGVPDDPAYDLGVGAGFYVDATQEPWASHYRMYSYVARELPALLAAALPIRAGALGVTGHSMGGHGALVLGLREPQVFRSVSALAPIAAPTAVPWGQKALGAYLGDDPAAWRAYDACALLAERRRHPGELLVDQGDADPFLHTQLRPDLLDAACLAAGQPLRLRRHAGYDHSYYFVATVIGDHIAHHAAALAP